MSNTGTDSSIDTLREQVQKKLKNLDSQKGKGVVTSNFTCPAALLQEVEAEFIDPVRLGTGYKLNRSGLIQMLLEILLSVKDRVDVDTIFDRSTCKEEIARTFRKDRRVEND